MNPDEARPQSPPSDPEAAFEAAVRCELLAAFLRARRPDLESVFQTHATRLLGVVQRWFSDSALQARFGPEDVLADAFLKARARWSYAFPGVSNYYVWLYQIARDCFIDRLREASALRRDFHRDAPWPEQSAAQLGLGLISPGTSPSSAAARKELFELVRQTMDLLRPHEREILLRRYYDDLTFGEVGELFGLSENAATQRCLRALRRLQKLWRQRHGDEGFAR